MTRRTVAEATTINDQGAGVVAGNLAITPFQVSEATGLQAPLMGLQHRLEEAARINTNMAIIQAGGEFTPLEVEAMVQVEALRLVNGLDLTAVLLRAHYIVDIQRRGLLAQHPAHYGSLEEMASNNGMSVTALSQILDMVNIIFPYVESELGIPVYEFWERLGSSKVKELLAVLKAIITGQAPDRAQTVAAVLAATNEAADLLRTTRPDLFVAAPTQEQQEELVREVRRVAVDNLVTMAEGAETVRAVRAHIRPNRTPPVNIYELPVPAQQNQEAMHICVLQLTNDQLDMIRSKLGERATFMEIEGNARTTARGIPPLRRLMELIGG